MLLKFCGMTRQEDLDFAEQLGADFCGFIFHSASPRYIAPECAGRFQSHSMARVGIFVNKDLENIGQSARVAQLDLIQLHGGQSRELARNLGTDHIIKVLWPKACTLSELQRQIDEWHNYCAYFLLDSGLGGGGTGLELDWNSLGILEFGRPWFLAGGLNPSNIKRALKECAPAGLDVNSGVEIHPGIKDHERMRLVQQLIGED